MKTPSGFAHIGSLRGPLIHNVIYRAIQDAGKKAAFTFVINDFDPVDELPGEFKEALSQYLGFPLKKAPSPQKGFASLADFFASDFTKVLKNLGVEARYLSSWDMYQAGEFNGVIREALDNADKIQDIYQRVSGSKKREKGWLPLQVICEKCGKLGTTRVYEWDGEKVAYGCEPDLVGWAKGCGHKGKISPFDGKGKLPWKVDWPAHWKVIGVTIEAAGKDHASAGGSYDIAMELCKEVFDYLQPYKLAYEFFLIAGRKMSSSRGLGLKARDLIDILPPNVARFIFTRTDYRQAIEFEPVGTMAIPDLFDEYDECWRDFISGSDEDLARSFVLAQVGKVPDKKSVSFLPRFRDIANYLQLPNIDLEKKFEETKGSRLTKTELDILRERSRYAKAWIDQYAPEEFRLQMTESLPKSVEQLTAGQKEFLREIIHLLEEPGPVDDLQLALYNSAKRLELNAKEAFAAIYRAFLGKDHGPRAAWFLLQYPKEKVIGRLKEASK